MSETRSMHRRWVGSLLSLLLPGAGLYLAGERRAGLRWFFGLTALWLVNAILTPLPAVPGLFVFVAASCCGLALLCWMIVRSYRPVPKLKLKGWMILLLLVLAINAIEWIIDRQFVRPFKMPTGSMESTIMPGDHLFAQPCAYWLSKPKRGDVVIFETDDLAGPMPQNGVVFVKRIAALPGEKVEIKKGRLVVNDRQLDSPAALAGENFTAPFGGLFTSETNSLVLPADGYFVVGDNHKNSLDSRHFGAVPQHSIVGKATKIYWPPSRAGDIQ